MAPNIRKQTASASALGASADTTHVVAVLAHDVMHLALVHCVCVRESVVPRFPFALRGIELHVARRCT